MVRATVLICIFIWIIQAFCEGHHGQAHAKEGPKKSKSPSQANTTSVQDWYKELDQVPIPESFGHPIESSLPRSSSPCLPARQNERFRTIMEMCNLHENMWQNTSILRGVWKILAPLCRPDIWWSGCSKEGTMDIHSRLARRVRLGRSLLEARRRGTAALAEVSQASPDTTQAIQSSSIQKGSTNCFCSQRQRQGKQFGSSIGTTDFVWCQCSRLSMAQHTGPSAITYDSCSCSLGRGQANEEHHGPASKAQRGIAARSPGTCQRCSDEGRSGRDQTAPLCCSSSWTCQARFATGAIGSLPPTCSMAGVFDSSCDSMEGLQRPVCRAGEAAHRSCAEGSRGLSAGKGCACQNSISGRGRVKRRWHERRRCGKRGQGSQYQCCRQNQGGDQQFTYQSGSPPIISRPNGRGRAKDSQKAQIGIQTNRRLPILLTCSSWFLIGRVNMSVNDIAHRPSDDASHRHPMLLKWSHSILNEPDFLSEWQAQDNAFHLAWQFGYCARMMTSMQELNEVSSFAQPDSLLSPKVHSDPNGPCMPQPLAQEHAPVPVTSPLVLSLSAVGPQEDRPRCQFCPLDTSVLQPDFNVSVDGKLSHCSAHAQPECKVLQPVITTRRDFESPLEQFPNHASDEEDEHDPPHDLHNEGPAEALFLRDMINGFRDVGVEVHVDEFTAPIRSWFLDHATIRQWFAPRTFQLHGPPQSWESQIVAVWRDQLDHNEWFDVTIVRPPPPRPSGARAIVIDMVISQSIHLPRHAGLVTVLPAGQMQFTMYSVAVSFNYQISGDNILQMSDAKPLCRRRLCTITHRWQEIPPNDRLTYEMGPGDAFQVLFHANQGADISRKKPRHHYHAASQASSSASSTDVPMHPASHEHRNGSSTCSDSGVIFPVPQQADCECNFTHDEDLHGQQTILHVFQLDGPTHVITLHGQHGIHPSHAVAQAIGVPLTQLEILHQVPIRPTDIPRGQTAVIAHWSGDIDYNQNQRLILIDIIYHNHPTTWGHMTQPTKVRLVQAAPDMILRDSLLQIAAVLYYCQFLTNDCVLQLDGHLWPASDQAPRAVYHGSYAIVDVPPPQGHDLDTQTIVQILQSDRSDDEVFNELFVMSPEEDAATMMQMPSSSMSCHQTEKSDQISPCFLSQQEQMQSTLADETEVVPTVVQPIASVQLPVVQGEVPLSFQAVSNPLPTGQRKISDFFPKVNQGHFRTSSTAPPLNQLRIDQFFKPKLPQGSHPNESLPQPSQKYSQPQKPQKPIPLREAKCDTDHVVEAPIFEAPIPTLMLPALPPERGHHLWRLDLQRHFEDRATAPNHPDGPMLYVQVWFVHHGRFRTCPAPKIVRLEDEPEHWYACLIDAWREQIQFHVPVRVEIVAPQPAYTFHEHAPVHIILEQQGGAEVAAILFTAAFHGGYRMGLFQVAESVPSRISPRLLIQHHQFQRFCDFRPCRMFSGRFLFEMDLIEEIPTGISVLLDVGQVEDASSSSSTRFRREVDNDGQSLMQKAPPMPQSSTESVVGNTPGPIYKAAPPSLTSRRFAQAELPTHHTQAPVIHLTVLNLPEFQETLQWVVQQRLADSAHDVATPVAFATWFIDATRLPRTDHFQKVVLPSQRSLWTQELARRWHDFIDPSVPLEFHLVQPSPLGGDPDIIGHVILRQHTFDAQRAALLSVIDWNDDPWNPMYVCTLLSPVTTYEDILYEAMVENDCPPVRADAHCSVQHGSIMLTPGIRFPVRHGYGFEVAASIDDECQAPAGVDSLALIQLSFRKVHSVIHQLQAVVHAASNAAADATYAHIGDDDTMPLLPRDGRLPAETDAISHMRSKWRTFARPIASTHELAATVVVWFLDHIRMPQCYQSRTVMLFEDWNEWEPLLLHAWRDALLPDSAVLVHTAYPDPEDTDTHVLAHVILTQQAIPGFKSILISTYDSAFPGEVRLHASMAPDPLPRHTLYALAYLDRDCAATQNTCSAWHGMHELPPLEAMLLHHGMSFIVAIHRQLMPGPEEPDPWQSAYPRCKGSPVVLSLQASLPTPSSASVELDDTLPHLLWFESDAWLHDLANDPEVILHPLPEGLCVPPVSYWALVRDDQPEPMPFGPPKYSIYVDGSAGGHHAAWGLILTQHWGCHERFIGCTYGQVVLTPEHHQWIGATTVDNIAAELTAMIVAQCTVLRWPDRSSFSIRPDLSLSRMLAQATSVCRSNPLLAQLCKVLGLWTTKLTLIEEVRGHTKHPWNELADALAKWTITHDPIITDAEVRTLHRLAQSPHDLGWSWMQTTHASMAACFPPMVDQQILQFTPSDVQMHVPPTERRSTVAQEQGMASLHIKVQTANVLATEVWSKHLQGTKRTGQHTTRLDAQWNQAGIHAVGVQEARTPEGCFQSPNYLIYASGAKTARAPLYGCELWLHRTLPIGSDHQGAPLCFGQAKITIQHADPRRLFVQAQLGSHCLSFVVLHNWCLQAAVEGQPTPIDQLQAWWLETSALLHKYPASALQWILIDANSPLDADCDGLVGPLGAEPSTKQGQLFKQFLQTHRLAVPSTFPTLHWANHDLDTCYGEKEPKRLCPGTSQGHPASSSFQSGHRPWQHVHSWGPPACPTWNPRVLSCTLLQCPTPVGWGCAAGPG